jgi:DNA ligase-1
MNFFDAIYVDGELLINTPFGERRRILERIVRPIHGKIQLARQITTDDLADAEKFYKSALEAKQEGIMLKVLDSSYVFGRHVDGWIKIKPVMETLDLLIVGATWGEGSRANWLTSFALACRDPDSGNLLDCGMMSTGLTEEEYREMTKTLKPLITGERGKDVKVRPEVIVEVAYQEIQKSPTYSSGFALRFPAFKNLRPDKDDADTIDRVRKLYASQGRSG